VSSFLSYQRNHSETTESSTNTKKINSSFENLRSYHITGNHNKIGEMLDIKKIGIEESQNSTRLQGNYASEWKNPAHRKTQ
jgi:hypothetical protein